MRGDPVEIDAMVRSEWHDRHVLTQTSCAWLREHADPGDVHPIATAVLQLRADECES